jgi:hypothetical protein
MERLVVVRLGKLYSPISLGKWSSPELPDSQVIRNLFMEGSDVIVLLLGKEGKPLYMGKVLELRPRNPALDSAYPPEYQTFVMFSNYRFFDVSQMNTHVFNPILESIRFTRGAQIHIEDDNLAIVVMGFYYGLQSAQNVRPAPLTNVTVFNPNFFNIQHQ